MEKFGKAKLEWLRQFAPFTKGMPPHDRMAAVILRLNPKTFQACFCSWTRTVAAVTEGEVVAVDGKTARGARDRRHATPRLRCTGTAPGASAIGWCWGKKPPRRHPTRSRPFPSFWSCWSLQAAS